MQNQILDFWLVKSSVYIITQSVCKEIFSKQPFFNEKKKKLRFCVTSVSTFWKLIAKNSDSANWVKIAGKQMCRKMRVLTLVKGCHQDLVLVIPKHWLQGANSWDENPLKAKTVFYNLCGMCQAKRLSIWSPSPFFWGGVFFVLPIPVAISGQCHCNVDQVIRLVHQGWFRMWWVS